MLRPLPGCDKEEIITQARRIDIAEISVLADEDCCSPLTRPHVATRTNPERLPRLETHAGLDELVGCASPHPGPDRGLQELTSRP